jgi:hypothetical protein
VNCSKGHYVSNNALFCATCAMERSESALQELQTEFLRKAANGEPSYTLRVAKGSERHVVMYSSQTRTFCGQELATKPQIRYEAYNDKTLATICAGCRSTIASVMEGHKKDLNGGIPA